MPLAVARPYPEARYSLAYDHLHEIHRDLALGAFLHAVTFSEHRSNVLTRQRCISPSVYLNLSHSPHAQTTP